MLPFFLAMYRTGRVSGRENSVLYDTAEDSSHRGFVRTNRKISTSRLEETERIKKEVRNLKKKQKAQAGNRGCPRKISRQQKK